MTYQPLPDTATLEERAERVNLLLEAGQDKALHDVGKAQSSAAKARIAAAVELYRAKLLVPGNWEQWCDANIRRSQVDINRLVVIGRAEDPEAAHEAINKDRCDTTAERKNTRVLSLHNDTDPVEQMVAIWTSLSPSDKARAKAHFSHLFEKEPAHV